MVLRLRLLALAVVAIVLTGYVVLGQRDAEVSGVEGSAGVSGDAGSGGSRGSAGSAGSADAEKRADRESRREAAELRAIDDLSKVHFCDSSGLPEGTPPVSAIVKRPGRSGAAAIEVVSFTEGWAIHEGQQPGTLIAVCAV